VSHGVNDAQGTRNAPAIQNMAFQRVLCMMELPPILQPIIPLTSKIEMNGDLNAILI
jgi:cytochrome c peroxidase